MIAWLEQLALQVSLEFFVLIASFIEELIAPIPSAFVMSTAAVISETQNYSLFHIVLIVMLAAASKTLAAVVVYIFVDKAEDVVVGKFGKVIGVTHKEVETIGKILTKTWYDDVLFLIARSLPFVPSIIVSVVAGTIKYNFRSYVIYTFFGFCVLCSFYLWVGFVGIEAAQAIWEYVQGNTVFRIVFFVVALIIIYLLKKVKDHVWNLLFKKAEKHSEK